MYAECMVSCALYHYIPKFVNLNMLPKSELFADMF